MLRATKKAETQASISGMIVASLWVISNMMRIDMIGARVVAARKQPIPTTAKFPVTMCHPGRSARRASPKREPMMAPQKRVGVKKKSEKDDSGVL